MRPRAVVVLHRCLRSVALGGALVLIVMLSALHARASPSWDGTWREIVTAGPKPAARAIAPAIVDTPRSRMIVFGGTDDFAAGTCFNDVWALSLIASPAWEELSPVGTPPTPRVASAAAYDPLRERMIVWSGYDGFNDVSEVWSLSLSDPVGWTEITPAGETPIGRGVASLVYDPTRDRMVMFGGFHEGAHNDVWALSLAGTPTWTRLYPSGTSPHGRGFHTGIFDAPRDRMVIFGGQSETGFLNDVWALSFSPEPAWIELQPAGPLPPVRSGQCGGYDPLLDRLVVFSGSSVEDLSAPPLEDVWALTLAEPMAWGQLFPSGPAPHGRVGACGTLDAAGDALVLFGGIDEGVYLDDTWALAWGGAGGITDEPRARLLVRGANPLRESDRIEITLDGALTRDAELALYDVQGRRLGVLAKGLRWSGAVRDLPIHEAGQYLLRARMAEVTVTRTLVVLADGR